jgi:hypothetical protein
LFRCTDLHQPEHKQNLSGSGINLSGGTSSSAAFVQRHASGDKTPQPSIFNTGERDDKRGDPTTACDINQAVIFVRIPSQKRCQQGVLPAIELPAENPVTFPANQVQSNQHQIKLSGIGVFLSSPAAKCKECWQLSSLQQIS